MRKFILFSLACLCLVTQLDAVLITLQEEWVQFHKEIPKGKLVKYQLYSHLLNNRREVWVYTPAGYIRQQSNCPLLIVFDGQAYTSQWLPIPIILDNLIAKGLIPPLVAVFVSSIDHSYRNRELPCYIPFAKFLAHELVPWAQKSYQTIKDPSKMIVAGASYGGLAASYAALKYPNVFGNVLSQSGAFWWKPKRIKQDQWLTAQFKQLPKVPIRFYLDAGDQETDKYSNYSSIIESNRNFRDALKSKGYTVYYDEFNGRRAYKTWKKTFAQGLMMLIGNTKKL